MDTYTVEYNTLAGRLLLTVRNIKRVFKFWHAQKALETNAYAINANDRHDVAYHRIVLGEYILLKIRTLVDPDKRTTNLKDLQNSHVNILLEKYKTMFEFIDKIRNQFIVHQDNNFFVTNVIPSDYLRGQPVEEFLDEIEPLLVNIEDGNVT